MSRTVAYLSGPLRAPRPVPNHWPGVPRRSPYGLALSDSVPVPPEVSMDPLRRPQGLPGKNLIKRLIQGHNPKGIEGRVELLRQVQLASIEDPEISRQLALHITLGCPRRNDLCELQAIWWFMHAMAPDGLPNVRYTGDIDGSDTFQTARSTLQFRGGDCDDGMTLIATLARGNGFRVKGRITANQGGGSWAHIYPLAGYPKNQPTRWIPLDWTIGYHRFGAHPPQSKFLEFDGHQVLYGREIRPSDYEGWDLDRG